MVTTDRPYLGAQTSNIIINGDIRAFLAVPERGRGPFGAVVLGHERYGLVQHTLDLTAKFAQFGFVGIAPDMLSHYDGDVSAVNRGEARFELTDNDVRKYMGAAFNYLRTDDRVHPDRIAAMGVCQSGEYPLLLNSVQPALAANIVVYGAAGANMWQISHKRTEPYEQILQRVNAPILGIWGEKDHVIDVAQMTRLRNVLEEQRKSYEFRLWPDMPHGWFNDTMPGRYRPRETDQAWALIIDFLERAFSGAFPSDRAIWRFESNIALDYDFTTNVRLE